MYSASDFSLSNLNLSDVIITANGKYGWYVMVYDKSKILVKKFNKYNSNFNFYIIYYII